ncbi:MAG: hypothetical protein M1816_006650 [Peltula sp. TS41687]|nr:MAG: hypothetical protein M1816_006650 [Peltula sp. TS41687]
MVENKSFIFKAVPEGKPVPGKDLVIETHEFDPETSPPPGGITTRNHYFSLDPYLRGRMRPAHVKSYVPAFEVGKPITNYGIVKVLKSDNPRFQAGDVLHGDNECPFEEYSVFGEEQLKIFRKIDNPFNLDYQLFVGALGMPGLTAYSSLYEIGKPKKGETIFISAASGAVGQIVGQLAKHEGLKVIGSVGDDKKLEFIKNDLGFDEGFNYKKEKPLAALGRLAPNGIDIYYENVGGEHLDAALANMNLYGRIIACGMISQYNNKPEEQYGVKNLLSMIPKRLKMQGFLVMEPDFGPKYFSEHQKNLQKWIHEGTFRVQQSVTEGMENAADGWLGMLEGKNFGKALLKVADLEQVYSTKAKI